MDIEKQIRVLCAYCDKSQADLARLVNQSPAGFNAKLKRGTSTVKDMEKIALAVGAEYKGLFILPDGTEI